MLKSLVIGLGSAGTRHFEILNNLGHEVATVSKRNDINGLNYSDVKVAIDNFEPNYVIISNETNKHIKTINDIILCGYSKKILVEKPISHNLENFNIPTTFSKKIYVGYNLRFHPFIDCIKKILANEMILSLNVYVGKHLSTWRPNQCYENSYSSDIKLGGGVLLELSHELDYLLHLFGKCIRCSTLISKLSNLKINCEDSVVGILKFTNCDHVSINLNLFDRVGRREIIVNTNRNSYKFDLLNNYMKKNNKVIKFSCGINETYKKMHLNVLNNNGNDACSYGESIEILKLIKFLRDNNANEFVNG